MWEPWCRHICSRDIGSPLRIKKWSWLAKYGPKEKTIKRVWRCELVKLSLYFEVRTGWALQGQKVHITK